MAPSHVLVPLDGSPLAAEALTHALETYECRLTVLNVVTPVDASMSEGGVLEVDDDRVANARDRAERLVDDAVQQAAERDRSIETAVETGDPADAIQSHVDASDVDHVVMGGHGGARGVASRLLGTVATTVVAEVPASVTVIR